MTITQFLLARIAEDEARARAASNPTWGYEPAEGTVFAGLPANEPCDQHPGQRYNMCDSNPVATIDSDFGATDPDGEHIAAWDPARVLRECEAKRQIVERLNPVPDKPLHPDSWNPDEYYHASSSARHDAWMLAVLASVYAYHPDYDPAWAVDSPWTQGPSKTVKDRQR